MKSFTSYCGEVILPQELEGWVNDDDFTFNVNQPEFEIPTGEIPEGIVVSLRCKPDNATQEYLVYRNGRWCDTVYFPKEITTVEAINSLVTLDNYPPDIVLIAVSGSSK